MTRRTDALVVILPAATGRDINGLARLVAKYCCHRGLLPTLEVFERRAIFRGIVLGAAVREQGAG